MVIEESMRHKMFESRLRKFIGLAMLLVSPLVFASDLPPELQKAQAKCDAFNAAMTDMVVEQEMIMAAGTDTLISAQKIYRRGTDSRMDFSVNSGGMLAGMPTVVIHRGEQTTMITPLGKNELSPEEAAEYAPERICWDFAGHDAVITGSSEIDGHDCHVVAMTEQGEQYQLYLDKERDLVLGGLTVTGEDTLHWTFSDFRTVAEGFDFPHRIDMYGDGELVSTMVVSSVQVNSGIAGDVFDADKVDMPTAEDILQQMMQGEEQK